MNSQLKRSNGMRNLYKKKNWILIASVSFLFILLLILLLLYFSGVFSSSAPKPTEKKNQTKNTSAKRERQTGGTPANTDQTGGTPANTDQTFPTDISVGNGEKCSNNDDCDSGFCGQYVTDDYRCCSKINALGSFRDWCINLDTDEDCKNNIQCTSGWCSDGKCKDTLKSQEKCTSNYQCDDKKCGRNKAGTDDLVCCAGGMSAYAGYDYCTGRPKGTVCWADKHCTSGNCSGNWSGLKKGTCD